MNLLDELEARRKQQRKSLAVLIDPDKVEELASLQPLISLAKECYVDFFLVGGSLLTHDNLSEVVTKLKTESDIPVILFPGNSMQICGDADAILFLSLISGRNADFLIGQHVNVAPLLKKIQLEIIPTGYLIINSDNTSAVSYMSNTLPIPHDKYTIATSTALAGQLLGMRVIYLDAGSGSTTSISQKMIKKVRAAVDTPLIVGGGIRHAQKAAEALDAGADLIVIGNAIEKNPNLIIEVSEKIYDFNKALNVH